MKVSLWDTTQDSTTTGSITYKGVQIFEVYFPVRTLMSVCWLDYRSIYHNFQNMQGIYTSIAAIGPLVKDYLDHGFC